MSSRSLTDAFKFNCGILPESTAKIVVGLSGGADSVTLLHLICTNPDLLPPNCAVEAVYVHHGISSKADSWSEFCAGLCRTLHVDFCEERVVLDSNFSNVEAQAREKRYRALASHLDSNSVLATAHHLNDLVETFLLALKRGSGLPGLSAMGVLQKFAGGLIWRPLLDSSRAEIEAYTGAHGLSYVTDDSNFDIRYDRNFFRHEIVPRLVEHFPEYLDSIRKSAAYIHEAQVIVDQVAEQDLYELADSSGSLELYGYRLLSPERQHNVLRRYIHGVTGKYPSAQLLQQFDKDFVDARTDSVPVLKMDGWELRKFRERLYIVRSSDLNFGTSGQVEPGMTVTVLARSYRLMESDSGGYRLAPDSKIELCYDYSFSLKIHPYNRSMRRELKKLFSEYGIAYWERRFIPVVKIDGRVAGLFPNYIDAEFYTPDKGHRFVEV